VVAKQQELLSDVITDEWWQDVTLPMLEAMRRRLRGLVRLIPKIRRAVVYTDFEDELGELTEAELKGITLGTNRSRFETKVRTYLRSHEHESAVQKLMRNRQVTVADLNQFKSLFLASAFGSVQDIELVEEEYGGLGLFLRSITGLEYEAAAASFHEYRSNGEMSSHQLQYIELLVNYLAKNGTVDVDVLYDPPFTGLAPGGPEDIFSEADIAAIEKVLQKVRSTAMPEDTSAG
jgi:type I restriction enzyme R subunit